MSLGWQCESALLPSKSKPINVDGKSMVGLKALLYNEEQNKTGTGSSQRTQRKPKTFDSYRSASDKPASRNGEQQGPSVASSTHEKETAAFRALQAKAKLYDEINSGKSLLQSDLIDFENKTTVGPHAQDTKPKESSVPAVPPPRPPPFKNPSASQPTTQTSTANNVNYNTMPPEQAVSTQPQWNWSTTYATSKASSSDAYARNIGTSAASTTADHTSSYLSQVAAERELKRVISERVQEEQQSTLPTVSDGARVKTQWEKTLNSSARGFLDEIHDDVAVQREVAGLAHSAVGMNEAGQKRSAKEEKLELIRQKRLKL